MSTETLERIAVVTFWGKKNNKLRQQMVSTLKMSYKINGACIKDLNIEKNTLVILKKLKFAYFFQVIL